MTANLFIQGANNQVIDLDPSHALDDSIDQVETFDYMFWTRAVADLPRVVTTHLITPYKGKSYRRRVVRWVSP